MAIPILAQIGIGLISSIVGSVVSSAISKGSDSTGSVAQNTPSSSVKISDAAEALKKNAETAKAGDAESPMDQLFAKAPDSVKKAWEKTRKELGLDTGNKDYYVNPLAMIALTGQPGLTSEKTATDSTKMPSSVSSAISTVDAAIERLNTSIPGYDANSRSKQAALEMFSAFRQNLINASSTAPV